MPAAMMGYFAWSFVEFTITDKTLLGVLVSLHCAVFYHYQSAFPGDPPLKWSEEQPI